MGTEEADIELVHCLSHVKAGQCLSDDKDIYRQDESHQGGGETEDVDNEARGSDPIAFRYICIWFMLSAPRMGK